MAILRHLRGQHKAPRLGVVSNGSTLESVLKRDRFVILGGLAIVIALAAFYTIGGIGMNMSAITMTQMAIEMPGMMMQPAVWTPTYVLLVFFMWWVMMIAMMVPSAAPTILIFAGMARKQKQTAEPFASVFLFLAGYLLAWAVFSLVAMLLQWLLEKVGVVSGMMEVASPLVAGSLLIAAGLYQLTSLKEACLKHCQHPVFFLMHHWKPGRRGALQMGWEHGIYCLGCCWFLMTLLFVGGTMNLLWIGGLALYVGVEKLAAAYRWVTTLAAIGLTVAGIGLISSHYLCR